jgi:hypothetical protein
VDAAVDVEIFEDAEGAPAAPLEVEMDEDEAPTGVEASVATVVVAEASVATAVGSVVTVVAEEVDSVVTAAVEVDSVAIAVAEEVGSVVTAVAEVGFAETVVEVGSVVGVADLKLPKSSGKSCPITSDILANH